MVMTIQNKCSYDSCSLSSSSIVSTAGYFTKLAQVNGGVNGNTAREEYQDPEIKAATAQTELEVSLHRYGLIHIILTVATTGAVQI